MMRGLGSMLDVLDLILSSIVNKTKKKSFAHEYNSIDYFREK
jgi:hypothetical protein